MDIKDIAKAIRQDIKAAGIIGLKTSVRISRYSMGCSLNLEIKALDFNPLNPEYIKFQIEHPRESLAGTSRYNRRGDELIKTLDNIVRKYHVDNSDTMTDYYDVNFSWSGPRFEHTLEKAWREEITANMDRFIEEHRADVYEHLPLCELCSEKITNDPWQIDEHEQLCWDCYHPRAQKEDERKAAAHAKYMKRHAVEVAQIEKPLSVIPGLGIFVTIDIPNLNKNNTLEEYMEQVADPENYRTGKALITETVILSPGQYDLFTGGHLLSDIPWLAGKGGTDSTAPLRDVSSFYEYTEAEQEAWIKSSYSLVIEVKADDRQTIYVDPQGYSYARYVSFLHPEPRRPEPPKRRNTLTLVKNLKSTGTHATPCRKLQRKITLYSPHGELKS